MYNLLDAAVFNMQTNKGVHMIEIWSIFDFSYIFITKLHNEEN